MARIRIWFVLGSVLCLMAGANGQGTSLSLVFKSRLNQMKEGAAAIKDKEDKARWKLNIELWDQMLSQKIASKASVEALKKLKTSVGKLKDKAEKQRWTYNLALWDGFVGKGPPPDEIAAKPLADPLKKLKANLEKLPEGAHLDRWAGNFHMFKSVLSGFIQIK